MSQESLEVLVHSPVGEDAKERGLLIVSINGRPYYRLMEPNTDSNHSDRWRWSRSMDYWKDDGMGHDAAHGSAKGMLSAVRRIVDHYRTRRVREQPREPREESVIE